MTSTRVGIPAVLFFSALLALPSAVLAQAPSTFIIEFNRTGFSQLDDAGNPVPNTGALLNPCTAEFVDVTGSSTITISDTVLVNGDRKLSVSVVSKGTGTGLTNGTLYAFRDSQSFNIRRPATGGSEVDSSFTDKLILKGSKSIDNWFVRALFRVKVTATGQTLVELTKVTDPELCRG